MAVGTAPFAGAMLLLASSMCLGHDRAARVPTTSGDGARRTPFAARALPLSARPQPARGQLLVARRGLEDPNFTETVVLLLVASDNGAMGIILNRPTTVRLARVLPTVKELRDRPDSLFAGGPVGPHALVLLVRAPQPPAKSERIVDGVYVTSSMAVVRDVLGDAGKSDIRAYVGYAGWGPGQLEHEIEHGDWFVGSGEAVSIFDTPPEDLWSTLIARLSGQWTEVDPWRGVAARVPVSRPLTLASRLRAEPGATSPAHVEQPTGPAPPFRLTRASLPVAPAAASVHQASAGWSKSAGGAGAAARRNASPRVPARGGPACSSESDTSRTSACCLRRGTSPAAAAHTPPARRTLCTAARASRGDHDSRVQSSRRWS